MLRTVQIALLLISTVMMVSGCMWASVDRPSLEQTLPVSNKMNVKEIVPASQQGVFSSSGYRVHSSVSFNTDSREVTTAAGYKVSMGVQSTLFKEGAE